MVLIGSKALKFWFKDFNRDGKDVDYAVRDKDIFKPFINEKVELLVNPIFVKYVEERSFFDNLMITQELFVHNAIIANPNELYTLKMSHIFWDISWSKHMFDIQFLLKKGCKLDKELFYKLYEYWNEIHGKNKRSDLKMSAEDFFDNAVKCEHSHDYLHTLIKDPPTYTKVLVGEVEVSEDKFNLLTFEEKCELVQEEVMVMAYERYSDLGYLQGYSVMLKKFIISHAPLWEAIFIIENFIKLHKAPFDYLKLINSKIKNNDR